MKIAYTLNGLIGGISSGKNMNADVGDYSNQSSLVLRYVSKFLKKHVLENNDVDIFIFSWEVDKLEEFKNLIKNMIEIITYDKMIISLEHTLDDYKKRGTEKYKYSSIEFDKLRKEINEVKEICDNWANAKIDEWVMWNIDYVDAHEINRELDNYHRYCKENNIEMLWGVGGGKIQSSSTMVKEVTQKKRTKDLEKYRRQNAF